VSTAAEKLGFLLDLQSHLGGSIPFERWMQEALYHPKFGYYTTQIKEVGRRGDFTTWPARENNLAQAVAAWVRTMRCRHVIEVGAGSGELGQAVIKALGWWKRPQYHIVEISPVLENQQRAKLGEKAHWHPSLAHAVAACDGEAIIISNELVDAFPCRVFQFKAEAWQELALRIEDGKIQETWSDAVPPDSTVTTGNWPDGQRVEVHESYRRWLGENLANWRKGALLTIDYGDACPGVYHRRPRGTLRSYAHHQRLEGADVYGAFGLRDMTADVNFSDLIQWSPQLSSELLTLSAFLARYHRPLEGQWAEAGEAFQVLIQVR
jgi:SAM-dependent MidA family methyltransferase